jgi:hypothetical protein
MNVTVGAALSHALAPDGKNDNEVAPKLTVSVSVVLFASEIIGNRVPVGRAVGFVMRLPFFHHLSDDDERTSIPITSPAAQVANPVVVDDPNILPLQ